VQGTLNANLKWLVYVLLVICSLFIILPFIWLVLSTFKSNLDVMSGKFLPSSWNLNNYKEAFTRIPILRLVWNGLFAAILAAIGGLFASAMAAFAFAKLNFTAKGPIFFLMLTTLMIPSTITMIPVYIIMMNLGLVNSLWALILPHWTGGAFAIFFLRQHMMSIPHDLYEAAKMDGAHPLRIFFTIFLPLVRPSLATLAVLFFLGHWNDLMGPLIYLNSPSKMTLTVGLTYFQGQYSTNYPIMLAGVLVSLVPTFMIFLFAQKYLTKGVLISGIK